MNKQFLFARITPALFSGDLDAVVNLVPVDFVESPCKPHHAKNDVFQPIYVGLDFEDEPSGDMTIAEYQEFFFFQHFSKVYGEESAAMLIEKLEQISEGLFVVGVHHSDSESTTVIMIDDQQNYHFTRLFKLDNEFVHSFDHQSISPLRAVMIMATNSY